MPHTHTYHHHYHHHHKNKSFLSTSKNRFWESSYGQVFLVGSPTAATPCFNPPVLWLDPPAHLLTQQSLHHPCSQVSASRLREGKVLVQSHTAREDPICHPSQSPTGNAQLTGFRGQSLGADVISWIPVTRLSSFCLSQRLQVFAPAGWTETTPVSCLPPQ